MYVIHVNSASAPQQPFQDSKLLNFFLFSPAASGWPGNGKRNADTSEQLQSITEAFALLGSMTAWWDIEGRFIRLPSAKPNHSISHQAGSSLLHSNPYLQAVWLV